MHNSKLGGRGNVDVDEEERGGGERGNRIYAQINHIAGCTGEKREQEKQEEEEEEEKEEEKKEVGGEG
jgi:hypothetical protein